MRWFPAVSPPTSGRGADHGRDGGHGRVQEQNPTAVTLAEFEAAQVDARVLVTWETVSEVNNQGFNLYRRDRHLTRRRPAGLRAVAGAGQHAGLRLHLRRLAVQPARPTGTGWRTSASTARRRCTGRSARRCSAPTAVTLASVSASPAAAPAAAALPWLLAVAGAGAALALRRRRR